MKNKKLIAGILTCTMIGGSAASLSCFAKGPSELDIKISKLTRSIGHYEGRLTKEVLNHSQKKHIKRKIREKKEKINILQQEAKSQNNAAFSWKKIAIGAGIIAAMAGAGYASYKFIPAVQSTIDSAIPTARNAIDSILPMAKSGLTKAGNYASSAFSSFKNYLTGYYNSISEVVTNAYNKIPSVSINFNSVTDSSAGNVNLSEAIANSSAGNANLSEAIANAHNEIPSFNSITDFFAGNDNFVNNGTCPALG